MAVNSYYFDASVAGPTDPGSVWLNDANLFDSSIVTSASTATLGTESSNYLEGKGTTAPTISDTITQVRARLRYDDGSSALWTSYITLLPPLAGWTPTSVSTLETRCWFKTTSESRVAIYESGQAGNIPIGTIIGFTISGDAVLSQIEVEVTSVSTGKFSNISALSNISTLTF